MTVSLHAHNVDIAGGEQSCARSERLSGEAEQHVAPSEQLFKTRIAIILRGLLAAGWERKRLAHKLGLSDRGFDYLLDEDRAPSRATCARLGQLLIDRGQIDDALLVVGLDFRPTLDALVAEGIRAGLHKLLADVPAPKLSLVDGGKR